MGVGILIQLRIYRQNPEPFHGWHHPRPFFACPAQHAAACIGSRRQSAEAGLVKKVSDTSVRKPKNEDPQIHRLGVFFMPKIMVPKVRVELTRGYSHRFLSLMPRVLIDFSGVVAFQIRT